MGEVVSSLTDVPKDMPTSEDKFSHVPIDEQDYHTISLQLGRRPRGVLAVSYRCPDGAPGVITTMPRLPDGTPFPTLYYLTDPRLVLEASRQESEGVMRFMSQRLKEDPELAENYRLAHKRYLQERNSIEDLGTDFSGGGMPSRVKCLHVLMAYSLVAGPGVCRLGDEALAAAADSGLRGLAIPEDWPTSEDLVSSRCEGLHPTDSPVSNNGSLSSAKPVSMNNQASMNSTASTNKPLSLNNSTSMENVVSHT